MCEPEAGGAARLKGVVRFRGRCDFGRSDAFGDFSGRESSGAFFGGWFESTRIILGGWFIAVILRGCGYGGGSGSACLHHFGLGLSILKSCSLKTGIFRTVGYDDRSASIIISFW